MDGKNRRAFLKNLLTITVFSGVTPHLLKGELYPTVNIDDNVLSAVYELEISKYPELLSEWGCILLAVQNISKNITEQFYVTRVPKEIDPSSFTVVSIICPHEGIILDMLNPIDHTFSCTAHSGVYSVTGECIQGPDMEKKLVRYYCQPLNEGDKFLKIKFDFETDTGGVFGINSYIKYNYPNPFKDITTILYGIAEDNYVYYEIIDLRHFIALKSPKQFKYAGEYSESIDLSNFPDGVYYFNLYLNGSMSNSIKMIKNG